MSHDRVGKTRRRALVALAGFGVLAAVPFTMGAVGDGAGLARGAKVVPTKQTPAVVKIALQSSGPVVVAFLLPGITEDEIVQKRLNTLQRSSGFRDTKFIVYRITGKTKLGDLPEMFGIKYTPAVAVIQGDDKLSNVWRGMVDEDIIAQSLIDARNAVPHALKVTPRKGQPSGNAAGIALARKVNASYAKAAGIALKFNGNFGGVAGSGNVQFRLVNGRQRRFGGKVQAANRAFEFVADVTGTYSRAAGAACWSRSTKSKDVASIGDKAIPLRGMRFDKPVTAKGGASVTLTAHDTLGQYGGARTIRYTIDAKSFQITAEQQGATQSSVTMLATAPRFATPDKIC